MSLQTIAFAQLLRTNGENVTFRGATVRALVNRTPKANNPPGELHISSLIGSVIQVPITVSKPTKGEVFTDGASINHRLTNHAAYLGHCWSCECEVTA